ncbi:D-beta-hydroxybutyrate dehydrogenase-like isoform X2 [Crassostrea virginica]
MIQLNCSCYVRYRYHIMSLEGKTAVVTGFGGGLGSAIAVSLAQAGCAIVGTDISRTETVQANIVKIQEISKHEPLFFECDLMDREAIQQMCQGIQKKIPEGVDILVNNAGMYELFTIEEKPVDSWDKEIAINLTAPFLMSKCLIPSMKKKGWGRIVNMSSTLGLTVAEKIVGYITTKTGLIGLTRSIALEGGPHGVTCNAICPYVVQTPYIIPFVEDLQKKTGKTKEAILEGIRKSYPTKKLTTPNQIGDYVVFLCSPAANNMTGLATPMDGGFTMV